MHSQEVVRLDHVYILHGPYELPLLKLPRFPASKFEVQTHPPHLALYK